MECRRKNSWPLILSLIGLFWWISNSTPVMGRGPIQDHTRQRDISYWLAELKARIPGTDRGKKAIDREDTATGKMLNNYPGQRISIDFYKADIHNIFRLLGKVSGKNIVVDESVKGNITLALQNVPWTFVLDVIKNLKGLNSIERYNTIMIYPASKAVKWSGNRGESGSLKVQLKPKKRPALSIVPVKGLQTPIEKIIRAQDLIKKAAESERQGAINQALDLYIRASDIWPRNVSLAKKIATLALARTGQELIAFNFARRALRFAPKDSEAATFAAIALTRMGETDEADTYFERAMLVKRPPLQTLYNYAVFCESRGRYRQALRLLDKIEDKYKISSDTMLLKAQAYEGLGKRGEALREYRAVLLAGKSIPWKEQHYARERIEALAEEKKR